MQGAVCRQDIIPLALREGIQSFDRLRYAWLVPASDHGVAIMLQSSSVVQETRLVLDDGFADATDGAVHSEDLSQTDLRGRVLAPRHEVRRALAQAGLSIKIKFENYRANLTAMASSAARKPVCAAA